MKNENTEAVHLGLLICDDKYRLAITACGYEAKEVFEEVYATPCNWLVTCEECKKTEQYEREITRAVANRLKGSGV